MIQDTSQLRPNKQFEFWRDEVCQPWLGLRAERDDAGPFNARVELHTLGKAQLVRARLPTYRLYRESAQIAQCSETAFCLHLIGSGVAHGHYAGQEYVARPGDMVLFDTGIPQASFAVEEELQSTVIHIPKKHLTRRLINAGPRPVSLSTRDSVGALLASYIRSLSETVPSIPERATEQVGDVLCDLINAAFAPEQQQQRGSIREARLTAARNLINKKLANPGFSPADVARELGVSERYVHKLFEGTGYTFGETLLAARLNACRNTLMNEREDHRSIADIAYSFGFNDLSGFYRRYRTQFGQTPRETRLSARCTF